MTPVLPAAGGSLLLSAAGACCCYVPVMTYLAPLRRRVGSRKSVRLRTNPLRK